MCIDLLVLTPVQHVSLLYSTSVHVFEGFLGLLWGLVLHVGVAARLIGVQAVRRHVHQLYLPIGGENLLDVIL